MLPLFSIFYFLLGPICASDKKDINEILALNDFKENALHQAMGNLDLVKSILTKIKDPRQKLQIVSMPNILGDTPLHYATNYKGGPEFIKILLAEIQEPQEVFQLLTTKNIDRKTPFQLAIGKPFQCPDDKHGYESVKIMLDFVPEITNKLHLIKEQDSDNMNSLHLAAKKDQVVQLLLNTIPSIGQKFQLLKTQDKYKRNPLHWAAAERFYGEENHCLAIKLMLQPFCPKREFRLIKMQDQAKRTPLHHSLIRGNYEEVKIFLNIMPKKNILLLKMAEIGGNTPVHYAAKRFDNPAIMKLILDSVPKSFELLLQVNSKGRNPLHITACSKNHSTEIMEIIMNSLKTPQEQFKLLKAQSNDGETPLNRYCQKKQYGAMAKLLSMIQNPDRLIKLLQIPNNRGGNCLHYLAQGEDFNSSIDLEKLLEPVTDLNELFKLFNKQDVDGYTIFHHATKSWNYKFIKIVLEKLPDYRLLQIKDDDGENPLFNCLRKDSRIYMRHDYSFLAFDKISVRLILAVIPDSLTLYQILQDTSRGLFSFSGKASLLHMAAEQDFDEFIKIVAESITDPQHRLHLLKLQDTFGNTPLHLAVRQESINSIKELMYAASSPEERRNLLEIKNAAGRSPLVLAAGKARISKTLIEGVEKPTTSQDRSFLNDNFLYQFL